MSGLIYIVCMRAHEHVDCAGWHNLFITGLEASACASTFAERSVVIYLFPFSKSYQYIFHMTNKK